MKFMFIFLKLNPFKIFNLIFILMKHFLKTLKNIESIIILIHSPL